MSKRVINKAAFDFLGVNYDEYVAWCEEHKFNYVSLDTRKMFFSLVKDGFILIKDGRIIKK